MVNLPVLGTRQKLIDPASELSPLASARVAHALVNTVVRPLRVMQSLEMWWYDVPISCLNVADRGIDEGRFAIALLRTLTFVLLLELLTCSIMRG